MKIVLKVIAVIALLLVAAALLVPMLVSLDDVTGVITEQVHNTTGRELKIDGEKSLSIFPSLSLQLNQVRLSNMDSGSQPNMVTMERLDVHIPWRSLLSGELGIDRFVIEEPVILLETDKDGNANWDLLPATEPVTGEADSGATLPAGFDITLGEVAIRGGKLTLLDHQAGSEQQLDKLALSIDLPSLRQDLHLAGSVLYRDEQLNLDLTVTTPAHAIGGEPFDLKLTLDSTLVALEYLGRISEQGGEIAGLVKITGNSLKDLLAWQDQALEAGDDAFNGFSLSSDIIYAGDTLQLAALAAKLDKLDINGNATLTLADTPHIKADIDLGMLDVNPYLPPAIEADKSAVDSLPAATSSEPIVWDNTPIDLSALKSMNADIALRSAGIRARDIKLDENALRISLSGGKAKLVLEKFSAYAGQGKGSVSVDASRSPYRIATDFDLSGIDAQPLLKDVVGFDKLMGKGQLDWQLKTTGVSQQDFVSALDGMLVFSFADGAIRGANIAAVLRSAQGIIQGDLSRMNLDSGFDNASQTDFSELGGSMQFSKGLGRNEDLTLASPLLRISGAGNVDLPRTLIDYDIKARLVASIEGQAAESKAKGVGIPIEIKGPFHDVKIKPDLRKVTEDQVKDKVIDKLFKRFR
jgi:AsmA protein